MVKLLGQAPAASSAVAELAVVESDDAGAPERAPGEGVGRSPGTKELAEASPSLFCSRLQRSRPRPSALGLRW